MARFHLPLSLLISSLPCSTAGVKQISVAVAGVNGEVQWTRQDNRLFRHSSHLPFNATDAIDKSKFITSLFVAILVKYVVILVKYVKLVLINRFNIYIGIGILR